MLRQRLGPPTSLIVVKGQVGPGFIPDNRTEISITHSKSADRKVRVCARESYFPDAQRVPNLSGPRPTGLAIEQGTSVPNASQSSLPFNAPTRPRF